MSTHKVLLTGMLIAASAGVLGISSSPAHACDDSPLMGAVCWMGGNYCPANIYLPADGRLVNVSEYEALFSLFGVTYGGDGRTTFGLPDLRGRAIAGTGRPAPNVASSPDALGLGQKVGNEQVALTAGNLAIHTHVATFTGQGTPAIVQPKVQVVSTSPSQATSMAPSAATPYLAGTTGGTFAKKMWSPPPASTTANMGGVNLTVTVTPAASGGPSVVNSVAGGTSGGGAFPVDTISPELVMTACVAVNGTYPVKGN